MEMITVYFLQEIEIEGKMVKLCRGYLVHRDMGWIDVTDRVHQPKKFSFPSHNIAFVESHGEAGRW